MATTTPIAAALAFALLATAGAASAQAVSENLSPIEAGGLSDLARGLLLDATVTIVGHEFFNAFALAWRELDGPQRYSLTIAEAPTARFGSTIRVQQNGRTVQQLQLGPSKPAAREVAQNLAGDLFRALTAAEAEEALFNDPDLGRQELR